MSLTVAGKNMALGGLTAGTFRLSLHTGNPTDAGTALEASGGSYARQTVTIGVAAEGARNLTNTPTFDVDAGSYSHFGIWADTVCIDVGSLNSTKVLNETGQIQINNGSISLT